MADSLELASPSDAPAPNVDTSGQTAAGANAVKTAQKAAKSRAPRTPVVRKEVGKGETSLPAARVSRVIKADPDVAIVSKDAVFLISKMAERFVGKLTEAAYTTSQLGGRRVLEYRDLASSVKDDDSFHFLREIVPMPPRPDEAPQKSQDKTKVDTEPPSTDMEGVQVTAGSASYVETSGATEEA